MRFIFVRYYQDGIIIRHNRPESDFKKGGAMWGYSYEFPVNNATLETGAYEGKIEGYN